MKRISTALAQNLSTDHKADVGGIGPVSMQAEAHADRYVDRRDRSLVDCQCVDEREVSAMLFAPVAKPNDPSVTFLCRRGARNEARFLQARYRPAPPMLLLTSRQILVEQAVHLEAAGAFVPQLNLLAHVHFEQPAVPIRDAGESFVEARKFSRRFRQTLVPSELLRAGCHIDPPARPKAQRVDAVDGCTAHVREEGEQVVLTSGVSK
jgi:hypothetical protein